MAYPARFRLGSGALNPETVARYDRGVFPVSRMLDPVARRWVGKNVFAVAERAGG